VSYEIVNPELLGAPKGFSHGMLAPAGGRVLFVAGQTALGGGEDARRIVEGGFLPQWDRALERVITVIEAAGGRPEHIGRMTVYVTDLDLYRAGLGELGAVWRGRMGRHYPAVALVQVAGLVDEGALVEIEATAVLP
jgi:enamine deaminase RidA (YjgF/YER057c/UK114 family)